MNKEYIEINKNTFPTPFSRELNDFMTGWNSCLNSVLQHKAADVEPVRHGKWTLLDSFEYSLELKCSACNSKVILSRRSPLKYCPHCGAKMDKEVN